jgi:hypothetical protein
MKKFIIEESERERILGMHKSATKKQYLGEQSTQPTTVKTQQTRDGRSTADFCAAYGNILEGFTWAECSKETQYTEDQYSEVNLANFNNYYAGKKLGESFPTDSNPLLVLLFHQSGGAYTIFNLVEDKNLNPFVAKGLVLSKQTQSPSLTSVVRTTQGPLQYPHLFSYKGSGAKQILYRKTNQDSGTKYLTSIDSVLDNMF